MQPVRERRLDTVSAHRISMAISMHDKRRREVALAYLLWCGFKSETICRVLAEPNSRRG